MSLRGAWWWRGVSEDMVWTLLADPRTELGIISNQRTKEGEKQKDNIQSHSNILLSVGGKFMVCACHRYTFKLTAHTNHKLPVYTPRDVWSTVPLLELVVDFLGQECAWRVLLEELQGQHDHLLVLEAGGELGEEAVHFAQLTLHRQHLSTTAQDDLFKQDTFLSGPEH